MTVKSNSDGRKFRRFKEVGTRASYVFASVDATASFRSKMRIEKIGSNRIRLLPVATDNCVSVRKRKRGLEEER